MTRCFLERLEIPGLDFAPAERRVDESAPALAIADPPIQFGQVPAFPNFRAKIGNDRSA